MNIIISDTNVISDLSETELLLKILRLDNIYVVDLVKKIEFNSKTCDILYLDKIKEKELDSSDMQEVIKLKLQTKGLSECDLMNYVIAKKYSAILLTGDKKLKNFALKNGVPTKGTLWLLEVLYEHNYLTKRELLMAYERLLVANDRLPRGELYKRIDQLKQEIYV